MFTWGEGEVGRDSTRHDQRVDPVGHFCEGCFDVQRDERRRIDGFAVQRGQDHLVARAKVVGAGEDFQRRGHVLQRHLVIQREDDSLALLWAIGLRGSPRLCRPLRLHFVGHLVLPPRDPHLGRTSS